MAQSVVIGLLCSDWLGSKTRVTADLFQAVQKQLFVLETIINLITHYDLLNFADVLHSLTAILNTT